jgi:hypothetical protein
VPFDYRAVNYDFIPRSARRIIVFTNYSIEQVEILDELFFDRLLEATQHAQKVYGINIEPVAWQFALAAAQANAPAPDWAIKSRESAYKRHYNRNFRDVISKAAARGILRIAGCELRSISGSPDFPAATIYWSRR